MSGRWVAWSGHPFAKLTGSGNDFVLFDHVAHPRPGELSPELIRAICHRHNGIGADGVVELSRTRAGALTVAYFNADGSRGELCGNATLCATAWSVREGHAPSDGFALETDAGTVAARVGANGQPAIDLSPVTDVRPGWCPAEPLAAATATGYATVGVPHVVVQVPDVDQVRIEAWGPALRHDPQLPAGANANFVSPGGAPGRWRIRTWERGVEGETLACGSGSVASALLLAAWSGRGAGGGESVRLETRSGRELVVGLGAQPDGSWRPTLSGEGRIVFVGRIGALA